MSDLDQQLITAYEAALSKLLKYYSKTNWVLCIVLLLDPRHKTETFD